MILCILWCLITQLSTFAQSSQAAKDDASKPSFTILDQKRDTISQKSDVGRITSITVFAGKNFRVKSVEITLARGANIVKTLSAVSKNVAMGEFKVGFIPGDRVIIAVKKIAEINGDKEGNVIDSNYKLVIPVK